jgi:hypothetical protein
VAVADPGPLADGFYDELFALGGKNIPDFCFVSIGLGVA